ncbi:hypothetical protein VTN49DRAFT_4712 [Thermomyces lanuginosus]|uniref:uncharacterized protein n=1 Tax=Thermomyces lanuginosus TaxID=5541 RepID=UPI003742F0AA
MTIQEKRGSCLAAPGPPSIHPRFSKLASIGSRSAWLGSRSEICPVRVDGIYGCELIDLILIRAHSYTRRVILQFLLLPLRPRPLSIRVPRLPKS